MKIGTSDSPRSAFERLIWKDDRMILDGIVFRLEDFRDESSGLGNDCFHVYKHKRMFDQYERFWNTTRRSDCFE